MRKLRSEKKRNDLRIRKRHESVRKGVATAAFRAALKAGKNNVGLQPLTLKAA